METEAQIQLMSFGLKHGEAEDCQLVFDVRDLPNPFYVPELKHHTGLESCVQEYVMQFPESQERVKAIYDTVLAHLSKGQEQLSVAIGCTGGHHRSVTLAETLKNALKSGGVEATVYHRDIQKEV